MAVLCFCADGRLIKDGILGTLFLARCKRISVVVLLEIGNRRGGRDRFHFLVIVRNVVSVVKIKMRSLRGMNRNIIVLAMSMNKQRHIVPPFWFLLRTDGHIRFGSGEVSWLSLFLPDETSSGMISENTLLEGKRLRRREG